MNCVSGMEQIEITCGATPVISSDLPDGVTPDMVSQGWFTIKQAYSGKPILDIGDLTYDNEENTASAHLTQEQTFKLKSKVETMIQSTFLTRDGERYVSHPCYVTVRPSYKEEVLT